MLRAQSFSQFACIRVVYLCENAALRPAFRPIPGVRHIVVDTTAHAFRRAIVLNKPIADLAIERPEEESDDGPCVVQSPRVLYGALKDADMVFLVSSNERGLLDEAHYVAAIARQVGALSVGVLSDAVREQAGGGFRGLLKRWRRMVDTVVFVPASGADELLSGTDLFLGIGGISQIISKPGLINVDFADVHAILSLGDTALLTVGRATGSDAAWTAARQLVAGADSHSFEGAQGILLNLTGGPGLTIHDIQIVAEVVREHAHPEANIIIGTVVDYDQGDEVAVTLVATGFLKDPLAAPAWEPPQRHALPLPAEPVGKETPRERVWERWWPTYIQVPPSLLDVAPAGLATS